MRESRRTRGTAGTVAAAGLAVLGDVPAAVTLAGLAALQLTLASATRWSRRY
ncbi:MAG: hypothetical protein M3O90_07615 [Actinomycetota bacterium]|nr:hypothetical protein [Actinomycetota bacterium]